MKKKSRLIEVKDTKILVADDNVVNQKVFVRLLQKLGFVNIITASNGVEALNIFDTDDFELILMDSLMPVMDGLEATRIIREKEKSLKQRRIPIIALTANTLQIEKERCLDSGMDDILTKPVTLKILQSTLERHLSEPEPRDD